MRVPCKPFVVLLRERWMKRRREGRNEVRAGKDGRKKVMMESRKERGTEAQVRTERRKEVRMQM